MDPTADPGEQRNLAAMRIERAMNQVPAPTHLDLSFLQLRSLPPVVGALIGLEHFHLSGNPLRSLPESLSRLGSECFLHGLDGRNLPAPLIAALHGDTGTWYGPTAIFELGSIQHYLDQEAADATSESSHASSEEDAEPSLTRAGGLGPANREVPERPDLVRRLRPPRGSE